MANAIAFSVTNSSGAPVTGAAAGMTVLARDIAGAVRTAPAVTELGDGVYQVQPTDADEAAGTALLIDTGVGNEPRRLTATCFLPNKSNQFLAVTVEDTAGALWTGAAPTVGSYRGKDGVTRTPPAVVALAGAYLWALVPSTADIAAEVAARIDGPVGSAQTYFVWDVEPIVPTTPTAPIVGVGLWSDLETAIVTWVKNSTGLTDNQVTLGHQNGVSRFPGPSANIVLGELVSEGADDELRWDFGGARPAGTEIHFGTSGWRTIVASVTFFSPTTAGDSTARVQANTAQSALRLPSMRSALNAAGLGVMDEGNVRWIPVLDSGQWYGQAVLEVKFILRQTASEAVGYIATYEATVTVT